MPRAVRHLALLVAAAAAMVMPAGASAHNRTTATIFQGFTSSGTPTMPVRAKSGYCYARFTAQSLHERRAIRHVWM